MGDLSLHFSLSEFACPCGCGLSRPHPRLIEGLENLRTSINIPDKRLIKVNSGIRCPKHNAAVGGAAGSMHLPQPDGFSYAADVCMIPPLSPREMWTEASRIPNFKGIGVADTYIHVDVRNAPRVQWNYVNGKARPSSEWKEPQ